MKYLFICLLLFSFPALAADNSQCVHVCAAVCISAEQAASGHVDCTARPQHICYQKYGICERAPNGVCMWKITDQLTECVQQKVGGATEEMMK